MKILLTGFEPFDGSTTNPSLEIIESLPNDQFPNHDILKKVLPVDSSSAVEWVKSTLPVFQPDIVLHLGEASSRSMVSLEKVAINWMDFRIADNTGKQIKDQKIFDDAPDAYFSSLPLSKIQENIKSAGIPVEISLSAGAYLCNQVFFSSMYYLNNFQMNAVCGFIHLPSLPFQVVEKNRNYASMSKDISFAAVVVALQTILDFLTSE